MDPWEDVLLAQAAEAWARYQMAKQALPADVDLDRVGQRETMLPHEPIPGWVAPTEGMTTPGPFNALGEDGVWFSKRPREVTPEILARSTAKPAALGEFGNVTQKVIADPAQELLDAPVKVLEMAYDQGMPMEWFIKAIQAVDQWRQSPAHRKVQDGIDVFRSNQVLNERNLRRDGFEPTDFWRGM